jgi:glycosyltransferase involved in cell wall biosynthesis
VPKLVWNAIVKNEAAVIDRCVNSLLPYIDGAIVVDTGSTDGTPERLKRLFAASNLPLEVSSAPFVNFEQARNEALRCARLSRLEWDYLLLADADMELKVNQQPWLNGEKGLSYDIRQTAGALGYYNRRLISRHAQGWYVGVTHEYLDIASAGVIDGAEFIDHADGANRPDKFSRDIALLEKALETETRPGLIQRYHFYLAGTYYDAGDFTKAAAHYKLRTTLGGFDEEVWYAQMRYAECLGALGDQPGYVWELLRAYQLRPTRGEVLYKLARTFRERGDNSTSLLFATPGLQLPHPKTDLLFVDDYAHRTGLKEEFAICAYYDPAKRKQGAAVCDELALKGSNQASGNLFWYLSPLKEHVPSFSPQRIQFEPPRGYVATNPSVINDNGMPVVLVRTVNYTITPEGQYAIRGKAGDCSPGYPIHTRNFLVRPGTDIAPQELALPGNWPEPKFDLVLGFEDSRLFLFNNELWSSSTVRELTPEGTCQQVVAQLVNTVDGTAAYSDDWLVFESHQGTHEKNWMPWVRNGEIQFVYRLGSLISAAGGHGFHNDPKIDVSRISGGSQVIQIDPHMWIALVHEAHTIPGRPNRYYRHRFVSFVPNGSVDRISPAFYLHDRQIEFVAGLAYFPDKHKLLVSYGLRDCEAWTAEMDVNEVVKFIDRGEP